MPRIFTRPSSISTRLARRPNPSHHPGAYASRLPSTSQSRNFFYRCSVFRFIYKYTLDADFLYFVLCRCTFIYKISNYYYYNNYYCFVLSIFYGHINSRSIVSILVVNGDREFTRLDHRFSRVVVELTRVNPICIMYHVTDQLRMSSRLDMSRPNKLIMIIITTSALPLCQKRCSSDCSGLSPDCSVSSSVP